MTEYRQWFVAATIAIVVVTASWLGWLRPVEDGLQNLRFKLASRPASGDIVFVEIDPAALANIGSASRARGLYADVVAILAASGAEMIVLDVNLRGRLGYFDDNEMYSALSSAAGRVRTTATMSSGPDHAPELPLERFAALAPPVFVGVTPDRDGVVRRYPSRQMHEGWVIESLATAVTPQRRVPDGAFLVDFGIELDTIPRVPVSALLGDGDVSPLISGKVAIVGVSDFSTQNGVMVPRYGMLSATAVQLLAAETVRQNRMLSSWRVDPPFVLVAFSAILFLILRRKMPFLLAAFGSVAFLIIIELITIGMQSRMGVTAHTAAAHVSQFAVIIAALIQELGQRNKSLSLASRERDSMRGILARVVADNFDGVVVIDHNEVIRAASKMAEDFIAPGLRGRSASEVLDDTFLVHIKSAINLGKAMDRAQEATIIRPGGERIVEFVVTLSSVSEWEDTRESAERVACLTFRDITERREAAARLTYLAEHDPLTGAASRMRFVEAINEQLATPLDRARGVTVLLVGLARLKAITDTLGHAFGDELVRQAVDRLGSLGAECVARLDGNRFGLVFKGLVDTDMLSLAETVKETLSRPYALDGHHAIVGARVGLSDSDLSGSVPEAIVSHATMALSMADDASGNATVVFAAEMDARIKGKQEMETALRAALERGQFSVHYQPQVDLDSGEIIGVEALARWTHPELGNISPGEFIPAAEATGLIIELGRWVLETACAEVATWPKPVRLSVNVSPMQFEHGDIVSDVLGALAKSGLAPERLDIEITESLLVAETTHVGDKLQLLRGCGVGVALDDFGTGYSSLSYLGRLPVDKIKIDQSFVRGLPEDDHATAIVRAVLMLAESLDKDVVAEGIETQDQAWVLRLAGCKKGQGYFFGRPGPALAILERLAASDADRLAAKKAG
ncbi:EAL domain-containing protein [Pelagibacterium limicola]|uniref:EAL domain-containing protein n=1 Tax=Pelagibacterium limicola TaxID=2791022 RepID=UPI0018AF5E12|nr:EAL domain-containing protein [Pelagibacterium limicola]